MMFGNMGKQLIAAVILACVGVCYAQVPTDEAAAKLRERDAARRAAATQPATITNAQLTELNRRLSVLAAENEKLRAQVNDLSAKLARATAPTIVQPSIATAILEHKILKGMTVAQAEQAMTWKEPFKIERSESTREGKRHISWDISANGIGGGRSMLLRTQVAVIEDGKVIDSVDSRFHDSNVEGNGIFKGVND